MKKYLSLLVCGTVFLGGVSAYQFDSAKEPDYPVLLPKPRNMTYGNETILIDPCTL